MAIVIAVGLTALADANHSYWFQPLESLRDIARNTALLGIFALGATVVIIAGVSQYAAFSAAEALIRDPALVRNAAAICLDADGRVVCRGGRGRVPGP